MTYQYSSHVGSFPVDSTILKQLDGRAAILYCNDFDLLYDLMKWVIMHVSVILKSNYKWRIEYQQTQIYDNLSHQYYFQQIQTGSLHQLLIISILQGIIKIQYIWQQPSKNFGHIQLQVLRQYSDKLISKWSKLKRS